MWQQRAPEKSISEVSFPCTPNPRPSSSASLRKFQLTKPNTSCTIITPASLRSDCCSASLRNAVRLPSGIDVHLHRNTQVNRQFRVWQRHRSPETSNKQLPSGTEEEEAAPRRSPGLSLQGIIDLSEAASGRPRSGSFLLLGERGAAAGKPFELPSEQRDLCRHSRAQGDHHSPVAWPRIAVAYYFIENKHYGWRGHVPVVS